MIQPTKTPPPSAAAHLATTLATNAWYRQPWIWPLIAAAVMAFVAPWLRWEIDRAIQVQLRSELETLLNADVEGLKIWLQLQKSNAVSAAGSEDVVRLCRELITVADQEGSLARNLAASPHSDKLAAEMAPWLNEHGYQGFIIADRQHRIIASHAPQLLGERDLPGYREFVNQTLCGSPTVSHPFPSLIVLKDSETGQLAVGMPTMYAAAPIQDEKGEIIGVLGLRLQPDIDFTRILRVAKGGGTGETYAFNKEGLMLSESRFDNDLKATALIPDRPDARSILQIVLRDPGGNLTKGYRPDLQRDQWPLTAPVASAIKGDPGVNVTGYRDYRGVPSVAAWTWLPEYEFGVVTEMDFDEAYATRRVVRNVFWLQFGMLSVAGLAMFLVTVSLSRLKRTARRDALKAKQLGQYQLEHQIGHGAMGVVYRGRHAMLRRATAIKLLNVEKTTPISIARFEREVRLTSQLNHPNTICIYDYGRTPEGIFYYAMEFLDGINLESLVESGGPLPEGRVIHLLIQLCGSLNEAHGLGLIHRDIKPANVMLCRRGGMADVVKLLDFGLVKAIDSDREKGLTAANALLGTPLYMSPEAVVNPDTVDVRSDLYSLGALGYFLLTGTPVFTAPTLNEIFRRHLDAPPDPPSQRLGKPVDPELEAVLLGCLEKKPSQRPATARDLAEALTRCAGYGKWTTRDADVWWAERMMSETLIGSNNDSETADSVSKRTNDDPRYATIDSFDDSSKRQDSTTS